MPSKSEEKKSKYSSLIIPGKPALIFEDAIHGSTLVISDLHLGYVYNKNRRGILLPYKQWPEEDLLDFVKRLQPKRLIIIGDFKDEIFGTSNPLVQRVWKFFDRLLELTSSVIIIKGNHDGKLEEITPENIEVASSTGILVTEKHTGKKIGLWHGHAIPALDVMSADITISAHAHPAYAFRDDVGSKITEKVWVKAKWKTEEGKERVHLVMPAFNKYIDGFSVDGDFFEKIIIIKEAIDFLEAEVFTLDGVLIGTIGELQKQRRIHEEKVRKMREGLREKKKRRSA
ncbi:MAG: metallophosphoesterase [Candidatus Heimdallarchaeota archaeon]